MKTNVILTVLALINLPNCVQPEALSLSIAGMEELVLRETLLIDNMEHYLAALERKAEVIRSNVKRMRDENEKARLDVHSYLINPLQAYSLLRRLNADWIYWELYMKKFVGDEHIDAISDQLGSLPTDEEFKEAVDAVVRLQDTYELSPVEIAVGILHGVQYDAKLSSIDCFSIAYRLYQEDKYEEASLWFHSALHLFNKEDTLNQVLEFDEVKILYFYAQTMAKQDLKDEAIKLISRLLEIEPNNANAKRQKLIWEMEIEAEKNLPTEPKETKPIDIGHFMYQKGCQGKFPQRKPNLYCVYNTTNNPFLKLAPFKMEVVNLDPYMVLFHDVISDTEIETLQTLSKPKLKRATVYNSEMQKSVPNSARTSKFAWFRDDTNNVTLRINQRLEDMTRFDLHTSEQLQVMNYGIGGHYDTHYDYFNLPMDNPVVQASGDRIATALFYLSDVEHGGATVFPNIEISVFPKKGSLILWYNQNSRGEGDPRTLHAACPVLVGSKWVCNKWIRERDQLFRRPCWRESY